MDADTRFWDHIAEEYAKKPFPKPEATQRKLAITRSLLRPEHRLLDLGCATGTLTLELAPHVAYAHGLDVSSQMIGIAQKKAAGTPNVQFRVEPAGTLQAIPDGSYDCVSAFNLLHLVPDPAALLRAIYRVLTPGGAFVSSTACLRGTWLPPYALILPVMRWIGRAPSVTMFTADELRKMQENAGFVDITTPEVGEEAPSMFFTARKPG
jgi:SAM-dependent methyltransferase